MLNEIPEDKESVRVKINSFGGDAFEGIAINNLLTASDKHINVEIVGIAASAASIIAMAGDHVSIAENGIMMIHDASGVMIGNQQETLEFAAILDKIDGAIAQTLRHAYRWQARSIPHDDGQGHFSDRRRDRQGAIGG